MSKFQVRLQVFLIGSTLLTGTLTDKSMIAASVDSKVDQILPSKGSSESIRAHILLAEDSGNDDDDEEIIVLTD
jgi:hypothetical protein